MDNRHKIKQYFITFPRWIMYDDFKSLADMLPGYSWIYIVQEDHDDADTDTTRNSSIHYHVSIVLKHPIAKVKMINWISSCFPNEYQRVKVEATKNFERALTYCQKESTVFFESGLRPSRVSMPKFTRKVMSPEEMDEMAMKHLLHDQEEKKLMKRMKILCLIKKHETGGCTWLSDYTEKECKIFICKMKYLNGR